MSVRQHATMTHLSPLLMQWLTMTCLGCLAGLSCGCITSEDHWRHYQSGGVYPSRAPSLSADQRFVYFSSPRSGNGDIFAYDRDKRVVQPIVHTDFTETTPLVSTTGNKLAYEQKSPGSSQVRVKHLDTGVIDSLSPTNVFDELSQVSPDGRQVIVRRSHYSGGLGKQVTCWLLSVEPSLPKAVEIGKRGRFSPDSRHLIVERFVNASQREFSIIDRHAGSLAVLGTGNWAAFATETRVVMIEQDGLAVTEFSEDGTRLESFGLPARVSPIDEPHFSAGRIFFVGKAEGRRVIYRLKWRESALDVVCPLPPGAISWRLYESNAVIVTLDDDSGRAGHLWYCDYAAKDCTPLLDLSAASVSSK
jgi:hypothetical protein